MLILSRRPGQIITIGDHVKIKFLGIVGDQIRMGFEAPEEIPIHRFEVYERMKFDNDGPVTARIKNFNLR